MQENFFFPNSIIKTSKGRKGGWQIDQLLGKGNSNKIKQDQRIVLTHVSKS